MDESSLAYSSLGVFLWGTAQLYSTTCLFLIQGHSWRQRFWRGTCTHSWDEWRSTPRPSAPIHPRPSSVISCDSELSPLQTGWLIDQFNQTYMWKLCKTFALSLPVRQLSWQEESFFSTYHPSLLAVFSLDVFVLFFHLSSTNHWKASALTQRGKSRCVVLLKTPMLTMVHRTCPVLYEGQQHFLLTVNTDTKRRTAGTQVSLCTPTMGHVGACSPTERGLTHAGHKHALNRQKQPNS